MKKQVPGNSSSPSLREKTHSYNISLSSILVYSIINIVWITSLLVFINILNTSFQTYYDERHLLPEDTPLSQADDAVYFILDEARGPFGASQPLPLGEIHQLPGGACISFDPDTPSTTKNGTNPALLVLKTNESIYFQDFIAPLSKYNILEHRLMRYFAPIESTEEILPALPVFANDSSVACGAHLSHEGYILVWRSAAPVPFVSHPGKPQFYDASVNEVVMVRRDLELVAANSGYRWTEAGLGAIIRCSPLLYTSWDFVLVCAHALVFVRLAPSEYPSPDTMDRKIVFLQSQNIEQNVRGEDLRVTSINDEFVQLVVSGSATLLLAPDANPAENMWRAVPAELSKIRIDAMIPLHHQASKWFWVLVRSQDYEDSLESSLYLMHYDIELSGNSGSAFQIMAYRKTNVAWTDVITRDSNLVLLDDRSEAVFWAESRIGILHKSKRFDIRTLRLVIVASSIFYAFLFILKIKKGFNLLALLQKG